jgi:hypothetical protein
MNGPTTATGSIEVVRDCAYYHPAGRVPLDEAMALLAHAVAYAREHRIPKLLVNAVGMDFPSPSLPERYFLARKLAATAQGEVQLALVVHAHMIDPERFGVMVARNAGMNVDVFSVEAEALEWLHPAPANGNALAGD